jgi:50S ribosomal subunit-associated GTPase HflX
VQITVRVRVTAGGNREVLAQLAREPVRAAEIMLHIDDQQRGVRRTGDLGEGFQNLPAMDLRHAARPFFSITMRRNMIDDGDNRHRNERVKLCAVAIAMTGSEWRG